MEGIEIENPASYLLVDADDFDTNTDDDVETTRHTTSMKNINSSHKGPLLHSAENEYCRHHSLHPYHVHVYISSLLTD